MRIRCLGVVQDLDELRGSHGGLCVCVHTAGFDRGQRQQGVINELWATDGKRTYGSRETAGGHVGAGEAPA